MAPNPSQKHEPLPPGLRPLFWSYRFDELDVREDRKAVIVQLVSYGTLADWRWLAATYETAEVRLVLMSVPMTEIRPRTRALASIAFRIPAWNRAPRGSGRAHPTDKK